MCRPSALRDVRSVVVAILLAVLLASCTSSPQVAATPTTSPTPTAPDTDDQTITADQARVADDLVDVALQTLLDLLDPTSDAAEGLDQAVYDATFGQQFQAQVPLAQLQSALADLRPLGPYEVDAEISRSDVGELLVRTTVADRGELTISLFVSPDGLIAGLLLTPGDPPDLETPVSTLSEAIAELGTRGEPHLSAATVADGGCTTDAGSAPSDPAPVGSAIRLYVLAAVVDAVSAGAVGWDDDLVLTEDVVSRPPGVLQDRPTPSLTTVQEAATLMVQVDDGTATDLLLDRVGRPAVEAAQVAWGHAMPTLNVPFPSTREMAQLQAADATVRGTWIDGDLTARQQVLADLADAPLPDPGALDAQPAQSVAIGWFASPEDLCRVMARLLQRREEPGLEPLTDILTATPGVPDEEELWEQIAFMGGSGPGLLSAVWVVQPDEGPARALTASLVADDGQVDEVQAILLMAAARDLLG